MIIDEVKTGLTPSNSFDYFESMLVYMLCSDTERQIKPSESSIGKDLVIKNQAMSSMLKRIPHREPNSFYLPDPFDDRVYTDYEELLIKPSGIIAGDGFEAARVEEDGSMVWVSYSRVNKKPKCITTMGQFHFGYEINCKVTDKSGVCTNFKSFLAFDKRFNPMRASTQGRFLTTERDYRNFIEDCSIKEDTYRPNAVTVNLYSDGKSAIFPVPVDFYQKEMLIRKDPITQTGRRKPILHGVCEHVRNNTTLVKSFSRGVSSFNVGDVKVSLSLNSMAKAG